MSHKPIAELLGGGDHTTVMNSVNRIACMTPSSPQSTTPSTAVPGPMVLPEGTACQCDGKQTRLSLLIDELLELDIQAAGKHVEIYNLRMGEPGCAYFYLAAMRDQWAEVMRDSILARSPAQIAKMEAAIGVIQT